MAVTEQEMEMALEESFGMLKAPELEHDDMTFGEKVIAHFGVKGMKWGVRKDRDGGGSKPAGAVKRGLTKAGVALDAADQTIKKGEKDLIFLPQANRARAANMTRTQVLGEAVALNRSSQFKGKDLKADPALKKAYFDKLTASAKKTYQTELKVARTEAWGQILGADTTRASTAIRVTAAKDRLKHAEGDDREVLLEMNLTLNELGQVVGITVPPKYLAHADTASTVADFLAHAGITPDPLLAAQRELARQGIKP